MKNLSFTLLIMAIFYTTLTGQILEKEANMSLGVQIGNEMVLDDIDTKDAIKLWKEYFKEYGKIKRNKKADEYYSTGVRINQIFSVSKIDVYSKFDERGSSTTMTMWVDLGMAFISSKEYKTEYEAVVEMMDDFRIYAKTWAVQEEFDGAEKDLEKMKKELAKLEKKNVNLHESIEKYEEKILQAKENIGQNKLSQDEKRITIDRQVEILKEIQTRLESIRTQ